MTPKMTSALVGLTAAIVSALVTFGVIGGTQASAVQTVAVAAIAFVGVVFVRSAR